MSKIRLSQIGRFKKQKIVFFWDFSKRLLKFHINFGSAVSHICLSTLEIINAHKIFFGTVFTE